MYLNTFRFSKFPFFDFEQNSPFPTAPYWELKRRFPELDNKEIRLILEFADQLGMRDLAHPLKGDISYEEAGNRAQRSRKRLFL